MSCLSLITLNFCRTTKPQSKRVINFCIAVITLVLITTILPYWTHGHPEWAFSSICKAILCSLVVTTFITSHSQKHRLFRISTISCCVCLSLLMIIQNSCFDIKQIFNDYSFPNVNKTWNEKYHSFWLVFLTWISLYLIGFNDLKSKYLTLLIIFYSVFATITSYSDSAKLAMLVSVCIFFISKFHARLVWKSFFIILVIYTLSFPFFWQIFPSYMWGLVPSNHFDRIFLFETASNAIVDNWLTGYGFGSTLSLNISEYLPQRLPSHILSTFPHTSAWSSYNSAFLLLHNGLFPGSHPHNLIALIWLDFGLVGALLFSASIYAFNQTFLPKIDDVRIAPYAISLIVSAIIIFSFSFSIWQTDVVLTYAMFFACLIFIMSNSVNKSSPDHE